MSFLASYIVSIIFDKVSRLALEDVEKRILKLVQDEFRACSEALKAQQKEVHQTSQEELCRRLEAKVREQFASMLTSQYSRDVLSDQQFNQLSEIVVSDTKRFPIYFSGLIARGKLDKNAVYNNYVSHLYAGPFYYDVAVKNIIRFNRDEHAYYWDYKQESRVSRELLRDKGKPSFFVAFGHSIPSFNLCTVNQHCDLYIGLPKSDIQQLDRILKSTDIIIRNSVRQETKLKLTDHISFEEGLKILKLNEGEFGLKNDDVKFFVCKGDNETMGDLEFELKMSTKLTSTAAPFVNWRADRFSHVKSIEFDLTDIRDRLESCKLNTYFANVRMMEPTFDFQDIQQLIPYRINLSIDDCLLPGQGVQLNWKTKP